MNAQRLEISGPHGESFEFELSETEPQVTIGRLPAHNTINFDDPERLVSRTHCLIEYQNGSWFILDNASRHGTYLRHRDEMETAELTGRVALADGDVILIRAAFPETGDIPFWEITFYDPFETRNPSIQKREVCLE